MLSSDNRFSKLILTFFLVTVIGFSVIFKPTLQYPSLELTTPENVQLSLLLSNAPSAENCQQILATFVNIFQAACPTCRIQKQQCLQALSSTQYQTLLSTDPLPYPTTRMSNGVATYSAADSNIALAACEESERKSALGSSKVICSPSNTSRPIPNPVQNAWTDDLLTILLILAVAGSASWFICYLTIRYEYLHSHFSHDQTDSGPQKFHAMPTPRIGGLALFGGLIMGAGIVLILRPANTLTGDNFGYLLLAAVPIFIGGVLEDITKNVGVSQRLLLSMISAGIGTWLLGAVINRVDIPLMDNALNWLPFAIVFTVFAVSGVTNAINIIDGYNGLAGGVSVIVLIAIALVAVRVNDNLILVVSVSMIGATLGFLVWNWPKGKIFMGDGGAYLLGFILAELSVSLVYRNPAVSPWFPVLLLAYPVFETLYSIYRRTLLQNSAPGNADAQHLHQFLFIKIVRGSFIGSSHYMITKNNSRVAPHLLSVVLLIALFSVLFWQMSLMLMLAFFMGCVLYVVFYQWLAKGQGVGRLNRRKQ